jgi:hypothetical protein
MIILLMKKCSGELDLMRKFEAYSKLFPLTNKLVSQDFKNKGKTIYQRYCKESQYPHLLHMKLGLRDLIQVATPSTKLRKSQKAQKCYFMK